MRFGLKLALLLPLFALMAPTGGYPSKPTFQSVVVKQTTGGVAITTTGGGTGLQAQAPAATQVVGFAMVQTGQSLWEVYQPASSSDFRIFGNSADRVTIQSDGGLFMAGATGGDKGAGTINATGLFINGVAASTATAPLSVTLGSGSTRTSTVTPTMDATLQLSLAAGTWQLTMDGPGVTGALTGQGGFLMSFGLGAANNTFAQAAVCVEVPVDGSPAVTIGGAISSSVTAGNGCFMAAAAFSSAPTIQMRGTVTLSATTTVGVMWSQASSNAVACSLNAGTTLTAIKVQ